MKTVTFTIKEARDIPKKIGKVVSRGFDPKVAFVFASARQDMGAFSNAFSSLSIDVMGCSTGGNIFADGKNQVIFEDEAVVTLLDLNTDHYAYNVFNQKRLSSFELGLKIGEWGKSMFTRPCFLSVASGLKLNGEEYVKGVKTGAGEDIIMFGGLAGDETKFEQNYVFSGKDVLGNGSITIVFDSDKIDMKGMATSGWVGLGKDLSITVSDGNIVYSIDEQPALEVYKKYLSVKDSDLPAIGVEYPLLIKRDDGSSALRAVMGVDKKRNALIFAGTVPQDGIVTFSSSPGFEVIDRTKEKISGFYDSSPDAGMMLLFSCMARHLALGPIITEEIEYPVKKWGMPLSGFFTYGEIGTNSGKTCDFYNQTYTLVILKEK